MDIFCPSCGYDDLRARGRTRSSSSSVMSKGYTTEDLSCKDLEIESPSQGFGLEAELILSTCMLDFV